MQVSAHRESWRHSSGDLGHQEAVQLRTAANGLSFLSLCLLDAVSKILPFCILVCCCFCLEASPQGSPSPAWAFALWPSAACFPGASTVSSCRCQLDAVCVLPLSPLSLQRSTDVATEHHSPDWAEHSPTGFSSDFSASVALCCTSAAASTLQSVPLALADFGNSDSEGFWDNWSWMVNFSC